MRNRSNPTPGLPLGKVENSLCSGALPLAHATKNARQFETIRLLCDIHNPQRREFELPLLRYWDWKRSSEMDDAPANPNRDRLSPIVGTQLFHDVLDMDLYGFLADKKLFGDFAVSIALSKFVEDLDFARG
jgi:hypothetical protein